MPEIPAIALKNLSVRYPYSDRQAIGPINLTISAGERVLLLGPSGAGKSTLLHTLSGFIPKRMDAELDGDVKLFGTSVTARQPAQWADTIAYYFQNAHQTLCGMRVGDEIAFPLENRGIPEVEIHQRVANIMHDLGLPATWLNRRTMSLSGGEKQLVALAATLAQDAPILIADEPTAHLSPEAAARFSEIIETQLGGKTLLIVDHRLDEMIHLVTRLIVLGRGGTIIADGPPAQTFLTHADTLDAEGIWRPLASRLDTILLRHGTKLANSPTRADELLEQFIQLPPAEQQRARSALGTYWGAELPPKPETSASTPLCRIANATLAPFLGPAVLKNVSVSIAPGEVLGILGPNGAGKSTLAASLAGVLRLKSGARTGPHGGIVFQNPEWQFTADTVANEIRAALPGKTDDAQIDLVLSRWSLTEQARQHPFELSEGQKRRLAIACLTATHRWPLIVLDEPTAGLDAAAAATLVKTVADLAAQNRAIAIVTHDLDFALKCCFRALVLGEGKILAEGSVRDLLSNEALLKRAGLVQPPVLKVQNRIEKLKAPAC